MITPNVKHALEAILAVGMAIGVAHCNAGCKPSLTPAEVEGSYTAELAACIQVSETKADADVCRAKVDAKYGVCTTPEGKVKCQ